MRKILLIAVSALLLLAGLSDPGIAAPPEDACVAVPAPEQSASAPAGRRAEPAAIEAVFLAAASDEALNPCCVNAAEACERLCSPCGIQFFNCPVVPPTACAPLCVCRLCRT